MAHPAVPWGLGALAVCGLCEIDICAMLKIHLYILINSRHTVLCTHHAYWLKKYCAMCLDVA